MQSSGGWGVNALTCCAHLFLVLLEEARRVHAVGDGTAHKGEPVEDEGRLIGVPDEHLFEHVQEDAQEQKTSDRDTDLRGQSETREALGQGASKVLDKTHSARAERIVRRKKKGRGAARVK